MKAIVDNDVILKGAFYGLLRTLMDAVLPVDEPVGLLGSARYVLTDVLRRRSSPDAQQALNRVLEFIEHHHVLEPNSTELELAAEFESCAQRASVALDLGESLLCAILVIRALPMLITGDKRAVAAMEQIRQSNTAMQLADGRIKCMEQLVLAALTEHSIDHIRAAICANPLVDKALFNCCGCSSQSHNLEGMIEGLNSYVRALRCSAPNALCR